MRRCFAVILVLLLWSFAGTISAAAIAETMQYSGEVRNWLIYRPPGLGGKPAPLLFVLHGSAGSGEDMVRITEHGFEKLANRDKWIVVYPDALERRWNDQGGSVDDVGFLLALIDKLAANQEIDRTKVFMAGISNGGMMAERMLCEQAEKIAAIAVVAGSMQEASAVSCKPVRPRSVLLVHGTEDPIVPWKGGAVAGFEEFGKVLPVTDIFRFWAERNQCSGNVQAGPLENRDPRDGTTIRRELFSTCKDQTRVELVTVEGGGHTWPGGYQYLPERFIGKTSREIDANTLIWEFFQRKWVR